MAVTKRKSDRSSAKTAASTDVERLSAMVAVGEGPALEFKRSTGELKEATQTLCAFLNGGGGTVLFGVGSNGSIEGQQVSDRTLRDVAQAGQRLEPPADLTVKKLSGKSADKSPRKWFVTVRLRGRLARSVPC